MSEDIKLDHRAKKRIKEIKKKARPGMTYSTVQVLLTLFNDVFYLVIF